MTQLDKSTARDETTTLQPKWNANGLITAIAVDQQTNEILMVAHMNEEALSETLAKGEAVYWSRSRKCLWHKGETSGHIQKIHDIHIDCDQDAIILRVDQLGGACHTGRRSCFYRRIVGDGVGQHELKFLDE